MNHKLLRKTFFWNNHYFNIEIFTVNRIVNQAEISQCFIVRQFLYCWKNARSCHCFKRVSMISYTAIAPSRKFKTFLAFFTMLETSNLLDVSIKTKKFTIKLYALRYIIYEKIFLSDLHFFQVLPSNCFLLYLISV